MKNKTLQSAAKRKSSPYFIMMSLYLSAFVGMFSETSLNIALPTLSQVFRVDTALAQWLVIGYMLVIGLVLPFASLLMKWFPMKKLTCFALGAFLVGCLMSGFAPNFTLLLLGRLVQGIGTGLVLPMMFSLALEVFPPARLGAAMGLTALIIMFAPAVGPTLSGLVLAALSWRWLFFFFAGILLVALFFAVGYMVEPYRLTKPPVDVLSCAASCVGFGGIVLGVGLSSALSWTSPVVIGGLAVGAAALVLYVRRQLVLTAPVLNLTVFSNRSFAVSAVLVMLNFGITLSAMYLFPQYLQNSAGLAVAETGILMLPGGIVNALVSLLAGKLYDRIGAALPVRLGFGLSIAGAALFLVTAGNGHVGYSVLSHIILMVGVPLAMSPAQTRGLNALPAALRTDGSTILNTMQQVLGAVCTAVATSLLGFGQGRYFAAGGSDNASAFLQGTRDGFLFTVILAVLGFVIAFGVKNERACQSTAPQEISEERVRAG